MHRVVRAALERSGSAVDPFNSYQHSEFNVIPLCISKTAGKL